MQANNYTIDLPKSTYETVGSHAICLCGYDEKRQAFRFKNSWGAGWGEAGYGWITYRYVTAYAHSAITLIRGPVGRIELIDTSGSLYDAQMRSFWKKFDALDGDFIHRIR